MLSGTKRLSRIKPFTKTHALNLCLTFVFSFSLGLAIGIMFAIPFPILKEEQSVLGASSARESLIIALSQDKKKISDTFFLYKGSSMTQLFLHLTYSVSFSNQQSSVQLYILFPEGSVYSSSTYIKCPHEESIIPSQIEACTDINTQSIGNDESDKRQNILVIDLQPDALNCNNQESCEGIQPQNSTDYLEGGLIIPFEFNTQPDRTIYNVLAIIKAQKNDTRPLISQSLINVTDG